MEIIFTQKALDDLEFWRKSGNKAVQAKIKSLLQAIELAPFTGIGKPEPLKENWTGFWSRRITTEHRLIYKAEEGKISVVQVRDHY